MIKGFWRTIPPSINYFLKERLLNMQETPVQWDFLRCRGEPKK